MSVDQAVADRVLSSFEVRAELESLVERDLLGPWDGPDEELPPGEVPAERYLLGRLVPARLEGADEDGEPVAPSVLPAGGTDGEDGQGPAEVDVVAR